MPAPGQEETVRIVALDRDFHVHCYRCEVCGQRPHTLPGSLEPGFHKYSNCEIWETPSAFVHRTRVLQRPVIQAGGNKGDLLPKGHVLIHTPKGSRSFPYNLSIKGEPHLENNFKTLSYAMCMTYPELLF